MEHFNQNSFLRIPSSYYMKTYTSFLLWMDVKFMKIEIHYYFKIDISILRPRMIAILKLSIL